MRFLKVEKVEHNKILLEGCEVEYTLTRKKVKHINLRIKTDATVVVSAPFTMELSKIEDFMASKGEYIVKNIRRFEKLQINTNEVKQYVDGEIFYLLGEKLVLKILQHTEEIAWSDSEYLYVQVKDVFNQKRKQQLVEQFFDNKREEVFKEVIRTISTLFLKYKVDQPIIKTRTMKSRWGSCIPSKNQITLNKLLIHRPKPFIEYVVLHEFCHFTHPNHSKAFYNFVAVLMPDWKKRQSLSLDK